MTINWTEFARRVPAGTIIMFSCPTYGKDVEGMLLELYPYSQTDAPSGNYGHSEYECHWLAVAPLHAIEGPNWRSVEKVCDMKYLINGQWRSFAEIMEDTP